MQAGRSRASPLPRSSSPKPRLLLSLFQSIHVAQAIVNHGPCLHAHFIFFQGFHVDQAISNDESPPPRPSRSSVPVSFFLQGAPLLWPWPEASTVRLPRSSRSPDALDQQHPVQFSGVMINEELLSSALRMSISSGRSAPEPWIQLPTKSEILKGVGGAGLS